MQMEMLLCSTVVGLPFLIPPMLLTGELFKAWSSCWQVKLFLFNQSVLVLCKFKIDLNFVSKSTLLLLS